MRKIFLIFFLLIYSLAYSQEKDLEFSLDINSKTSPLPKIFYPSIDLSGRGYHSDVSWPYHLAGKEVLSRWQAEIGFGKGLYRLYFNLWEIEKLKFDPLLKDTIFSHYEKIIKSISDAGGVVVLVLYGTPPGWAEVLDKRAPPSELKNWQALIEGLIRYFSCQKHYNIWYEVWSSPEDENFFLGTKRDYFNLYETVARTVKKLKNETKISIPVGGPGSSWWFQNFEGNNIFYPERSLIYELIRFCKQKNLPLDFISWHAFSFDPAIEKELTIYKKFPAQLIRDWLKYFRLDKDIPLIITEWNYDSGSNWSEERSEKSYITASFIPSRLKNMFEAGIDYQVYFCLEDFQNNKEGLNINRGLFSYSKENPLLSNAKSIYNVFLFLSYLGEKFFGSFSLDDFVGVLATRKDTEVIILIWNYIDPYLGKNFIFHNLTELSEGDRRILIHLFKTLKLDQIIEEKIPLDNSLGSEKLKSFLKKAKELNRKVNLFKNKRRNLKIKFLNLKGTYLYQRYSVNNQCSWDCSFLPLEEKFIQVENNYEESIELNPYSVELIILKKE